MLLIIPLVLFAVTDDSAPGEVVRGPYGVPHVFSDSLEGAFFHAGYAVAQDRLWQMDLSRRSARGKLSALIGRSALNSDKDAIRFGYTDAEYKQFFNRLSSRTQSIFSAYAKGVNAWIDEAHGSNKLPESYAGRKPESWVPEDSLAIGVNLVRLFGKGGAGEIRNLLLYTYLSERLGADTLNAIRDIAWLMDKDSPVTCADSDDPFKGVRPFPDVDPRVLEAHTKLLPKVNLLELLPAIRLSDQSSMKEIAAQMGLPFRAGSYAMVVSPGRSDIGVPLLLSAPQMGFQTPSVVHQISISSPTYSAVGMNVPGIPGVLIGHSPKIAWGFTSGVADTDDIFFVKLNPDNPDQYQHDGKWKNFERTETKIAIDGGEAATGVRELSEYGPVVLKSVSTGVAYCRKSTLWMGEADVLDAIPTIVDCGSIADVQKVALRFGASFNLFAATTDGDIGWFFCGRIPIRSEKVDPRLPAPGDGQHDWIGLAPASHMPYVINPKSGVIANWNNKPVSWWPNSDTPVWGRIFRIEALNWVMNSRERLSSQELEENARYIATHESEPSYFVPDLLRVVSGSTEAESTAIRYLRHWEYDFLEGSVAPTIYRAWFAKLQEEIFLAKTGNFMSPAAFSQAIQPTLVWNALSRRTTVDWLGNRTKEDVLKSSFTKAIEALVKANGNDIATWRYRATRLPFSSVTEALYSNRGTYIQTVELWPTPRGRFVAPPGTHENKQSAHAADQVALSANWNLFPMLWKREEIKK